ncbi:hypothetical protein EVAR_59675_1 [Eumeta japonica]|uniref:Uncharacterized protein n=1 Tax=Eumeta variegata TaxID=151549 RepID=A0A4C1ZH19_EUMVA|nr:hypothetical protein EVAR_59675_1 [Eumeta japonica]
MYNIKLRRESVASACRKTTKFLTANTTNLLKRTIPTAKKYTTLSKSLEDIQHALNVNRNDENYQSDSDNENVGEHDLDYYLGVKTKATCWRDREGEEQIRRDYLINHCGMTEEIYDRHYRRPVHRRPSSKALPKLKQVPFKVYKKKKKKRHKKGNDDQSWTEKASDNIIFKMFMPSRYDYSTSESYSECESSSYRLESEHDPDDIVKDVYVPLQESAGVRIKEVSEGRPCDNCPELCPGFIQHAWR